MIFGLGLEKAGTNPETMGRALELGVKFYDTAPTYGYGLSESNFGTELKKSNIKRENIIISTKTHERDPNNALVLLDKSLKNLQTDYIDIWSLHDLSTPYDLKVYYALEEAKQKGKVKNIGITAVRDPIILKNALQNYKFDYVMMTINIADKHYSSFIDNVLPYVGNTKIIAMQVFLRGKSRYPIHGYLNSVNNPDEHLCPHDNSQMIREWNKNTPVSAMWRCPKCRYGKEDDDDDKAYQLLQDCVNYVSSFPIEVMLIGCNGVNQLEQDLKLFNAKKPMSDKEKTAIEKSTYPFSDMLNFTKTYKK